MTHSHRIGLNRRELLQVGYSMLLGVSATQALGRTPTRPKSMLFVFLTGAASHLDTFDPKPDAPSEVRGEFGVLQTRVPGMLMSEHLPGLAARARQFALVRSLSHKDNNHTAATHHAMTGALQPGVRFDKPLSRDDWPCFASGVSYLRPPAPGIPAGVILPFFLREGPLVWPGQHAGFLGPRHDPWQIDRDPNRRDFHVDNLDASGLDVDSLRDRRALLSTMNARQRALETSAAGRRLTDQQNQAFAVLTSGKVSRAFDLSREPDSVRDRYGRHSFGQSLLLARRLIEAGVPVVQANMGRVQNWDSHSSNFKRLKNDLLPPLDRAVSALLDDLSASGLLDETLVMVMGEFGRTPKINSLDGGRDHWASCFSGLFAGAGVQGGRVIGRSDATASFPATTPISLDDVGATVYHVLGIDPTREIRDRLDRPVQLNRGEILRSLFS